MFEMCLCPSVYVTPGREGWGKQYGSTSQGKEDTNLAVKIKHNLESVGGSQLGRFIRLSYLRVPYWEVRCTFKGSHEKYALSPIISTAKVNLGSWMSHPKRSCWLLTLRLPCCL